MNVKSVIVIRKVAIYNVQVILKLRKIIYRVKKSHFLNKIIIK